MAELRRWIMGPESENKGRRAGRAKGIQKRFEDLVTGNDEAAGYLQQIIIKASCLAAPGWLKRLSEGQPYGAAENFLHALQTQTDARQTNGAVYYSVETDIHPLTPHVVEQAEIFRKALQGLATPMKQLAKHFLSLMDENAAHMESDMRSRIEAAVKGLMRRSDMTLSAWLSMLDLLIKGEHVHDMDSSMPSLEGVNTAESQDFADWFEVSRHEGRVIDIGMFRHYIDPMKPFAMSLKPHLHGMAVTSATLRADNAPLHSALPAPVPKNDNTSTESNAPSRSSLPPSASTDNQDNQWGFADLRIGSPYLCGDDDVPQRLSLSSPYDYAAQTKIIVINDINKNDGQAVSTAFRELFLASQGGALGIFTSIQRLKFVQDKIIAPLSDHHIPLYSQHVDDMDIGTLIDMFREDEESCLLGTDAVRDGVDVPGKSLRLLVFDRVPWPRPTILHRQRKKAFAPLMGNSRAYDEAITRLKLKQAYGRLIRSEQDKGVFVMLDSALPSRLKDAFPPDVEITRLSLADACQAIKSFL